MAKLLPALGLVSLFSLSACNAVRLDVAWEASEITIVVPDTEDPAVRDAARDLQLFLGQATGEEPALASSIEAASTPHLLLVGAGPWECPALPAEGYAFSVLRLQDQDALALCGGGLLGRQYAVYEYLFSLGFRFVHPEQTLVPALDALPARRPALLEDLPDGPGLAQRGFHIHTQHPLELLEALLTDDNDEAERAHRYLDWLVRNRQNSLQWILLDSVPFPELLRQAQRVIDYAHRRGVQVIAQTSFSSNQQNAHRLVDPSNTLDDLVELRDSLELLLAADWDAVNVNLGASEFSPTDPQLTIDLMNEAADACREIAGIPFYATNHVPAGLFAEEFGVNFFDLPKFAEPDVGVFVHTTMFYGLEGPAPVYGNVDFSRQRNFLLDQVDDRDIIYFPESAWWLTFDNEIPLFLPIYLLTRSADLNLLAETPGVDGHINFSSGWEWGYWLTDLLMAYQSVHPGLSLERVLGDLLAPLGAEVPDLLLRMTASQERALLDVNLMPFLSGEDPLTEIGFQAGIVFHSLAPAPGSVMRFSEDQLDTLSNQLTQLETHCQELDGFAGEWRALAGGGTSSFQALLPAAQEGAARRPQPTDATTLLEEFRDATEITAGRCRNALLNYRALVEARRAELKLPSQDPAPLLEEAHALTERAREIVAQREGAYRYEAARSLNNAETGGDGTQNLTDYPYRVHGRTHTLFFWDRRDLLVEEAIVGVQRGLRIAPQQFLAGESVTVDASTAGFDPGSEIAISWGDGESDLLTASETAVIDHPFPALGQLSLRLDAVTGGVPLRLDTRLSVANEIYGVPAKNISVTVPDNAVVDLTLRAFLPSLLLGRNNEDPAAPVYSLGLDRDGDGDTDPGTVLHLPAGSRVADLVSVPGIELRLPVESASGSLGAITVRDGTLTFRLATTTALDDTLTEGVLNGDILTEELVNLLVGSGVLEADGAVDLLAGIFGFDPNAPPERLAVELSLFGGLIERL